MDAIDMTKSKVNECVSILSRMEALATTIVLRGNCAHILIDGEDVVDNIKRNGVTCAKSPLPLTLVGCAFISNDDLDVKIKMLRDDLKTAKSCKFIYTAEGCGFLTDDIAHPLFHAVGLTDELAIMYEDYDAFVNMALGEGNDKIDTGDLTQTMTNHIVQSKVVKLDTAYGRIRISKNHFPLLGVASSNKPANFKVEYCVMEAPNNNGTTEYVLVLHTKYQKIDAVHLFTVEPY